jgi:uncharacterized protein YndB with AHSA1/START domain
MLAQELAESVCTVRRVLPASVGTVYRAWTDPVHAARWSWGRDYETVLIELDCRVDGQWSQHIRHQQTGERWFFEGVFRDVVPGQKLVHTFHWRNESGVDEGPSLVTIEFMPRGRTTEVVITHSEIAADKKASTESGWEDILDCVTKCLSVRLAL